MPCTIIDMTLSLNTTPRQDIKGMKRRYGDGPINDHMIAVSVPGKGSLRGLNAWGDINVVWRHV